MKKAFKIVLLSLAFSVVVFSRGMLAGCIGSIIAQDVKANSRPTYDIEKDGALIFSVGYASYWTNSDFSITYTYDKEYEPDETVTYSYVYDTDSGKGFLKDDSENRVTSSVTEPLVSFLDKKGRTFDGCSVIQDKDSLFVLVQNEIKHSKSFLCYFDGSKLRFVSGESSSFTFDKIKILDNFVK